MVFSAYCMGRLLIRPGLRCIFFYNENSNTVWGDSYSIFYHHGNNYNKERPKIVLLILQASLLAHPWLPQNQRQQQRSARKRQAPAGDSSARTGRPSLEVGARDSGDACWLMQGSK